jgi:hypothetical protein
MREMMEEPGKVTGYILQLTLNQVPLRRKGVSRCNSHLDHVHEA